MVSIDSDLGWKFGFLQLYIESSPGLNLLMQAQKKTLRL